MFFHKKKEEYVVIIGCGRLGAKIANELSNQGKDVLVIDLHSTSFSRLDSNFGGLNTVGDAMDLDVLSQAQLQEASCVLVLTQDDNVNHMIAQMIQTLFHVENVVVRLNDPEKRCVLEGTNIHVLCPALLSAKAIEHVLQGANV